MKKQDVEIINIEVQNLKDSITWWTNRLNAVERDKRELKKENEKLKNELKEIKEKYVYTPKTSFKEIIKLRDENKRLNNIINEFNKLIKNEINESKLEEDYDRVDDLEYCLATLQELKGSDKE